MFLVLKLGDEHTVGLDIDWQADSALKGLKHSSRCPSVPWPDSIAKLCVSKIDVSMSFAIYGNKEELVIAVMKRRRIEYAPARVCSYQR